jgi:anion-transporting  ArsA/GET3 family ATPase
MELTSFAQGAKVKFLIGKGGVGKTTVTCALARALAEAGQRVLIVELEGRPEVPRAFGLPGDLDYEGQLLFTGTTGGTVSARRVTPDEALLEYLADRSLARLSKRLLTTGVLDVVAGAIPGIRDVLVLGKIKQIANESAVDVVLVDAPATGHAISLLTSPAGVADVARSGPVREQAEQVVAMLSDPARCEVLLVTIPEELPITESVEAAFRVEDRAGVALGPVLCNLVETESPLLDSQARAAAAEDGIDLSEDLADALDAAAAFQRQRERGASEQLERLRRELPLPVVELPRLGAPSIRPAELAVLAAALTLGLSRIPEPSA